MKSAMKRIRRWFELRHLRGLWASDMSLKSIARRREWVDVLEYLSIEKRYRFIKLLAGAGKQRGFL